MSHPGRAIPGTAVTVAQMCQAMIQLIHMSPIERTIVLAAACALLWIVEGRRPLFTFGPARARHVGPNVLLASLTVLTTLAFTWALRPAAPAENTWPPWVQAVAGVAVL